MGERTILKPEDAILFRQLIVRNMELQQRHNETVAQIRTIEEQIRELAAASERITGMLVPLYGLPPDKEFGAFLLPDNTIELREVTSSADGG